jgi:hypothetical protein
MDGGAILITAVALLATELLALAALFFLRRHDINTQRNFNQAVLNLVLDVGIEARNGAATLNMKVDHLSDETLNEDAA